MKIYLFILLVGHQQDHRISQEALETFASIFFPIVAVVTIFVFMEDIINFFSKKGEK